MERNLKWIEPKSNMPSQGKMLVARYAIKS